MVFVTQDIGKYRILVRILIGDQAHGNSGYGFLYLYASIHQGQGSGTDGGHGRRSVGFQDIRNDPERVGHLIFRGQHALQRPVGQVAVSHFPAAGAP